MPGNQEGFTLIELLIAITILSIVAMSGMWVSVGAYEQFASISSREDTLDALLRARAEAQSQSVSSSTGNFLADGSISTVSGYIATITPDLSIYENGEFQY